MQSGALPLVPEEVRCHNAAEMHLHSGSRAPTHHTRDLSKNPYTAGNLHHPLLTRTAPVQKKRDFSRNRMPSLRQAIPQTCFAIDHAVEISWKGAGADNRSELRDVRNGLEKRCPFNQTSE